MLGKVKKYIQSAVEEMKKVTWPTKKETINYTLMVIGMSLVVALFLGGLDAIFEMGLQYIINK